MNSTADQRHGSLFRRLRGVSVVFLACLLLLGAARAEEPDPALLVVDDSIETQSRVEDLIDRLTLHDIDKAINMMIDGTNLCKIIIDCQN